MFTRPHWRCCICPTHYCKFRLRAQGVDERMINVPYYYLRAGQVAQELKINVTQSRQDTETTRDTAADRTAVHQVNISVPHTHGERQAAGGAART